VTTGYDIPGQQLVTQLAEGLKDLDALQAPEWAAYAKTATHKERAPVQRDWWYHRAASVLRKLYLHGPIGTERLARHYSGAKDGGSKPYHSHPGGRKVLRTIMQQLEVAGLVTANKGRGRTVSPQGQSLLNNMAYAVKKEMEPNVERLERY